MATLRGSTTILNAANLGLGIASAWAYVGSAVDLTLFIDDGGHAAMTWQVETALPTTGAAGLNGIDQTNPTAVPYAVLGTRTGAAYTIATSGTPVAVDLSPYAGQYIRVRPSAAVTAATVRINTVARNSRALRGFQNLWTAASLVNGSTSAVGFIGDEIHATLFVFAAGNFDIQVAPGTGASGLNEIPAAGSWSTLFDKTGTQIKFQSGTALQAIDLSPIGSSFIRLKSLGIVNPVSAALAVTD